MVAEGRSCDGGPGGTGFPRPAAGATLRYIATAEHGCRAVFSSDCACSADVWLAALIALGARSVCVRPPSITSEGTDLEQTTGCRARAMPKRRESMPRRDPAGGPKARRCELRVRAFSR
jgi:hypothetical protein